MSMAVIAGVATVAGAGYTAYSTSQQAKNSQEQIGIQQGLSQDQFDQNAELQAQYLDYLKNALDQYGENSTSIIGTTYQNVSDIIANIPGVSELMGEAQSLSLQDFQFRDTIQKQNLAFIEGGTDPQIREAQSLNASLAALDPSAFQGKMGDILKSNLYGLKAVTTGEPTGSFANLSAQNLYNFSQQGLSQYLAISDFFSREGTVDPISPLQTAFDLQNVEMNLGQLKIGNEQWRGTSLLNVEGTKLGASNNIAQTGLQYGTANINTLGNNLIGASNATIAAGAAENAGYTQAISQLISGISGYGATRSMGASQQAQTDYYKTMAARYSAPSKYAVN